MDSNTPPFVFSGTPSSFSFSSSISSPAFQLSKESSGFTSFSPFLPASSTSSSREQKSKPSSSSSPPSSTSTFVTKQRLRHLCDVSSFHTMAEYQDSIRQLEREFASNPVHEDMYLEMILDPQETNIQVLRFVFESLCTIYTVNVEPEGMLVGMTKITSMLDTLLNSKASGMARFHTIHKLLWKYIVKFWSHATTKTAIVVSSDRAGGAETWETCIDMLVSFFQGLFEQNPLQHILTALGSHLQGDPVNESLIHGTQYYGLYLLQEWMEYILHTIQYESYQKSDSVRLFKTTFLNARGPVLVQVITSLKQLKSFLVEFLKGEPRSDQAMKSLSSVLPYVSELWVVLSKLFVYMYWGEESLLWSAVQGDEDYTSEHRQTAMTNLSKALFTVEEPDRNSIETSIVAYPYRKEEHSFKVLKQETDLLISLLRMALSLPPKNGLDAYDPLMSIMTQLKCWCSLTHSVPIEYGKQISDILFDGRELATIDLSKESGAVPLLEAVSAPSSSLQPTYAQFIIGMATSLVQNVAEYFIKQRIEDALQTSLYDLTLGLFRNVKFNFVTVPQWKELLHVYEIYTEMLLTSIPDHEVVFRPWKYALYWWWCCTSAQRYILEASDKQKGKPDASWTHIDVIGMKQVYQHTCEYAYRLLTEYLQRKFSFFLQLIHEEPTTPVDLLHYFKETDCQEEVVIIRDMVQRWYLMNTPGSVTGAIQKPPILTHITTFLQESVDGQALLKRVLESGFSEEREWEMLHQLLKIRFSCLLWGSIFHAKRDMRKLSMVNHAAWKQDRTEAFDFWKQALFQGSQSWLDGQEVCVNRYPIIGYMWFECWMQWIQELNQLQGIEGSAELPLQASDVEPVMKYLFHLLQFFDYQKDEQKGEMAFAYVSDFARLVLAGVFHTTSPTDDAKTFLSPRTMVDHPVLKYCQPLMTTEWVCPTHASKSLEVVMQIIHCERTKRIQLDYSTVTAVAKTSSTTNSHDLHALAISMEEIQRWNRVLDDTFQQLVASVQPHLLKASQGCNLTPWIQLGILFTSTHVERMSTLRSGLSSNTSARVETDIRWILQLCHVIEDWMPSHGKTFLEACSSHVDTCPSLLTPFYTCLTYYLQSGPQWFPYDLQPNSSRVWLLQFLFNDLLHYGAHLFELEASPPSSSSLSTPAPPFTSLQPFIHAFLTYAKTCLEGLEDPLFAVAILGHSHNDIKRGCSQDLWKIWIDLGTRHAAYFTSMPQDWFLYMDVLSTLLSKPSHVSVFIQYLQHTEILSVVDFTESILVQCLFFIRQETVDKTEYIYQVRAGCVTEFLCTLYATLKQVELSNWGVPPPSNAYTRLFVQSWFSHARILKVWVGLFQEMLNGYYLCKDNHLLYITRYLRRGCEFFIQIASYIPELYPYYVYLFRQQYHLTAEQRVELTTWFDIIQTMSTLEGTDHATTMLKTIKMWVNEHFIAPMTKQVGTIKIFEEQEILKVDKKRAMEAFEIYHLVPPGPYTEDPML